VIISLAPGDKKKRGSHFDLGMIIALLYQTDQIAALSDKLFVIDAGRSSGTRSKQQRVFLPADDKEQEKKSSPKGAENVFSAL